MRRRQNRESRSSTGQAQAAAAASEAAAGRIIPDHELNVMGMGNITRRFDLDEPSNGPSIVFRQVTPYAAFVEGFSETGDISDQNGASTTDTTASPASKPLYPITNLARSLETDVWPVLENLFSSGTGIRYEVGFSEFVRYQAMLLDAYAGVYSVVMINKLTYHTDWTKVFPFTENVPKYLYDLASNFYATDGGLADNWLPILRRFETKIAFPRMVEEVKRMLTPMMSVDLNGRLLIPTRLNLTSWTYASTMEWVLGNLDYLDVTLSKAAATFSSFLPFPLRESDPWNVQVGVIDIDRESGWFNSGVKHHSAFGDSGDPAKNEAMVLDEADGEFVIYYGRHTQPVWAEVKLATILSLTDDVTDDKFQLETPHRYGNVYVIDDSGDTYTYDGATVVSSSVGFRYLDFANSRFASTDVDYGTIKPGTIGAEISKPPIERLTRLEASFISHLTAIKQ
jgi:hypothetical protein